MKKKLFCLILVITLALQLFGIPVSAEAASVSFTLGSATGYAGDTVSLSLDMDSSVAANTYAISAFVYDETALEFVSFENPGEIITSASVKSLDNDKVAITCMYFASQKQSGKLCDVVFKIKDGAAAADYVISYNAIVRNVNSNIDDVQVNSGCITVESSHVHAYQPVVTLPTCTEEGFTTYTCDCGDSYVADQVAALGHDLKENVVEPTCTTDGSTTKACTRCDYKEVTPKDALGHDYQSVVTAPTCTEDGYTTYSCSRCWDTYTADSVPALGHDLKETVVAASCKTEGSTTKACTRCDYKEVTPIATLDHDYQSVVTAPTCTEDGYTTYSCTRCWDTYTADPVPALGHDLKETVAEATCTTDGSRTKTCTRCDYQEVTPIDALGHDYQPVVTAPTCTESGYTAYTCTRCADTYIDDVTPVLDHSYDTVVHWNWVPSADGYTATAICKCAMCDGAEMTLPADAVTSSENAGYITYRATLMLGETECSTIKMDKVSYSLNVANGTIVSGGREDGQYSYADLIAVQAEAAAQGMFFDGWYLNGEKVSSNSVYKFNIKSDSNLVAQYNENPVEVKPLVTLEITDRIANNGKQQLKLIVRWELPVGYQPVKAGFVRGYNIADPETLRVENAGGTIKDSSVAAVAYTGNYTLNLSIGASSAAKDLSAVAYLAYKNASGELAYVYTDVQTSPAK